jgi:hypothetical protein
MDATCPENPTSLKSFVLGNELLGDTSHIESPNSLPHHHPGDCAAECDELEDLPSAHTIGNASHLASELPGRAGDKLQDQAASGVALHGSLSKRDLHFFKELLPLRLRKTNDQPSETR